MTHAEVKIPTNEGAKAVEPEPEEVEAAEEEAVSEVEEDEFLDIEPASVEELDSNEELWDGGPTAGQIVKWKEEFGEVYVTSITYDKHIVWRPLNRVEYKVHVAQIEALAEEGRMSPAEANLFSEEAIADKCILFGYDEATRDSLAGIPSLIAQEVMEASGFNAMEIRQL